MFPSHCKRSAAGCAFAPRMRIAACVLANGVWLAGAGCGDPRDPQAEVEALRADFAVATAEYLPIRHGTERDQPDFDLQGAWHAIHANVDGRELPKHDVAHVSELLEFHGGSAWLRNGDRELLRGQYDVDESRTPHVIRIDSDLLMGDLSSDHGPVHGTFEVSDDSLRICFTSINRPLPANFQPQSHETCMTYKRVP